ncbi:MAG TPA: SAM-dependent methyltransferase, partial [Thermoanaerobaculia bacterium]
KEGPISFRDFMTAALYDPQEGYYSRGARIGERGDFVTSPHVSPAFAAAIARRFADDADKLEGSIDFVEVGAGEGEFLEGFARALARDAASLARRVRLTAIERSPASRQALRSRKILPTTRLLERVEELPERSVKGWIFSNELYDALPVVRVVGAERGLEELRVGVDGDRFIWMRAPAPDAYREHLANFRIKLETGQIGEISFAAAPLYRRLARSLEKGRLVTFDYGHSASVLYHPEARRAGTLAVHFAGFRRGDPLSRPGEVDLTAHVNWDDLLRAGESEGLTSQPVARQGRYLAEAGLFDFVADDKEKWRAYRLVDPEGMGDELSVLIQSRDL